MIHQFVEEAVLSAEDEGDEGLGVKVKLQEGVDLGKDFDAHQVGFIDDQDRLLFFGGDFGEQTSEGFSEEGDREGTGFHLEREQDLLEQLEDGPGVGSNGNDPVLRGVKRTRGVAKRGRFARADLSGDDTNGAQIEGIVKSIGKGLEARQGIEVLDLDILRERFALKAEEVLIANHRPVSFRRVFRPDRMWSSEVQGDNCFAVRSQCAPCFV